MHSLVPWKKKRDKYDDEMDEDTTEVRSPKLTGTMQEPAFIMRDEVNAEAFKRLKLKKWW